MYPHTLTHTQPEFEEVVTYPYDLWASIMWRSMIKIECCKYGTQHKPAQKQLFKNILKRRILKATWHKHKQALTHNWFPAGCHQLAVRPCRSLLSWCYSSHPGEDSQASGLCDWTHTHTRHRSESFSRPYTAAIVKLNLFVNLVYFRMSCKHLNQTDSYCWSKQSEVEQRAIVCVLYSKKEKL